jgi:phosphopantetheinyl transferase
VTVAGSPRRDTVPDAWKNVRPAVSLALLRCGDADRFVLDGDSPLSEWERVASGRIAHARRRAEWIAGRLAVKWLSLVRATSNGEMSTARFVWPPPVCLVGTRDLRAISPGRYSRVEIRRDGDGAPRLDPDGVSGAAGTVHISIAHCGGWAVAALSCAGPVGVDIEQVAPRRPGFYETNLSDRERRWMSRAPGVDTNRVGTLLWVLKEAFLKTGTSRARTVWDISLTDLDIATPARHIASTWRASDADRSPQLVSVPVHMALAGGAGSGSTMSAYAAYGAISNTAVGVIAFDSIQEGGLS